MLLICILPSGLVGASSTPLLVDTVGKPSVETCFSVTGPLLAIGSEGSEIEYLQKILNSANDTRLALTGFGSPGHETEYFGSITKQAVIQFQEKYLADILLPAGLLVGTGNVGPFTRAKINQICSANLISSTTKNYLPFKEEDTDIMVDKNSKNTIGSIKKNLSTGPVSNFVPAAQVASCGVVVNTCVAGSFIDIRDSTSNYKWSCVALNSSSPVTCSINKKLAPVVPVSIATNKPLINNTLQWGVFSEYSATDLATLESLVGKQANMKAIFTNFVEDFPIEAATGLKEANKTLVIFWEQYGVSLDNIIAGKYDSQIYSFSHSAKSYSGPIILVPFHEMNGNWDPWSGAIGENSPAKVVAAWKHVHDVFGTISNVKFAWAVNSVSVPDTLSNAIANYYPGDDYVDYVAVDGFNFGSPWQSFDSIFSRSLATLSSYGKPIYILSIASAAGPNKAAWISDAFGVQIKKYPLVKGWVWFNENKEKDWRINSDSDSLTAFRQILP